MKRTIRKTSWIIIAAMLFAIQAWAVDAPASWAAQEVYALEELGMVPQYLQQDYTAAMTREDFCSLLVQVMEVSGCVNMPESTENPFTDTDNPRIIAAYQLHVVGGMGDGTFRPDLKVTRQEAAVMLANAITHAFQADVDLGKSLVFSDQKDIDPWARSSVDYITAAGVMSGTGKGFEPQGYYTREQSMLTMHSMLDKVLGYFDDLPQEPSQPLPEEQEQSEPQELPDPIEPNPGSDSEQEQQEEPPLAAPEVEPADDDIINGILQLLNTARKEAGVEPLVLDETLTQIAQFKSQDMANTGLATHDSILYGSPEDLYALFGYEDYVNWGENIACGQKDYQEAVEWWMNSPTHRANILRPLHTKVGIGCAQNPTTGILYWTLEFSN